MEATRKIEEMGQNMEVNEREIDEQIERGKGEVFKTLVLGKYDRFCMNEISHVKYFILLRTS